MKLKKYLESGNYLPPVIRDFHDQKDLFKKIGSIMDNREELKNLSWVTAQIFTIDIFLWFMARHGYTLQKSRQSKIEFESLEKSVGEFREQQGNIMMNLIKGAMGKGGN